MENDYKIQIGKVSVQPGQPFSLSPDESLKANPSSEQRIIMDGVGKTVVAYLRAAQELLNGKYAHIKDYAPYHLREKCQVLSCCCPDGVIIRYDIPKDKKPHVAAGWCDEKLEQLVPKLSESVVFYHEDKNFTSLIPEKGVTITLFTQSPEGNNQVIVEFKLGYDVVGDISGSLPQPPLKPLCLISVRNELEIMLEGVQASVGHDLKDGKKFLTRTKMRLPVGWECVEVFPIPNLDHWKPEYATVWAENDILATVVSTQFHELQLNAIDPNAAARKNFSKLLEAYKKILDSDPEREEILQSFLTDNPVLLCPSKIKFYPKLAIGRNVTDFVFQEATGDYVLTELEPSTDPLFVKSGDTSYQLNHARNQILDWRRYIEDNLATVQKELGLKEISSNPKGLIVIGRTKSLSPENKRKLISIENDSPKTKIVTYDDIFDNARTVIENILGPLWLGPGNTEIFYPK